MHSSEYQILQVLFPHYIPENVQITIFYCSIYKCLFTPILFKSFFVFPISSPLYSYSPSVEPHLNSVKFYIQLQGTFSVYAAIKDDLYYIAKCYYVLNLTSLNGI